MNSQRIQPKLGRGVVVVNNGSAVTVTWRRLAQEPENATYNVYVNGSKINSSPLNNTNYKTTTSAIPFGSKVSVSILQNGVESEQSVAFEFQQRDARSMYMDILFPDYPLNVNDYGTSFVWPADLDGDGEMDYVVDRKSKVDISTRSHKIQAYKRDGTLLWTVDMGPNVAIDQGQDDMVLAYDINCDGRSEVIIKSSDGTRFWDSSNNTWGKYVFGKNTGDIDGDGIIDYSTQNRRNPPFYVSIIDGMTGAEMESAELDYSQVRDGVDTYGRDNRQDYKGDNNWLEYASLCGQFAICYFDGVHPSLGIEVKDRLANGGSHHYYLFSFSYDWSDGTARNWHHASTFSAYGRNPSASQFHMVRVCDVDGDGIDELIPGGYGWNPQSGMVMSANIAHGDRFRLSDIDPERPGLECFAIQQYAGDMLGQILYQAENGKAIKKWYLSAVDDVGRGECMDIDPNHLGWEIWSTMPGVYDAKGYLIPELSSHYPCEGVWWDGDLGRENVGTSDSHYNVYVENFNVGRLIQIAHDSNWRYVTVYAKRAAFWGDIIGDWREELVLLHKENGECVGICGFSTDYSTDVDNIYCLLQDPHYQGDCTTKGYYQSPNPGFYLGYDMPRPQLPPVMVTDLVAKNDGDYSDYSRRESASYNDGKSVLFDLTYGSNTYNISNSMSPGTVYAMPVKGQKITFDGIGSLEGNMDLWKSQQGQVVINVPMNYTGKTYISEGILSSNNTIKGDVELRARGTLAGTPTVEGNLTLENALNYEGCRLMPGDARSIGLITLKQGLNVGCRMFAEMNVNSDGKTDLIHIDGNLTLGTKGKVVFTIVPEGSTIAPGRYKLIEYTGVFIGDMTQMSVRGIQGISYNIENSDNGIWFVVNEQRDATTGVRWIGNESNTWDYQSTNFLLNDEPTEFVANDDVTVGDDAQSNSIQLADMYPISGIRFENESKVITVSGLGGFSGTGGLTKSGSGRLNMNCVNSTYTGKTIIESGTVSVKELSDGGLPSSFGSASASVGNFQIGNATLIIDNASTSTNRALTLNDMAVISIATGNVSFRGIVTGNGGIIKRGGGQMNFTYGGTNNFKGGIRLESGSIAQGSWNSTFGPAGSAIEVTGNSSITVFNNNSTSAVPTLNNAISVAKGKTLTINTGQRCKIMGSLSGEGTVKISFPYVRGDFSTNLTNFEGTLNPTSGQFRLTSGMNLANGTFKPESGVYAVGVQSQSGTETSLTHKIGALSSSASDCTLGTSIWNVGYLNTNTTYAGIINSAATLNKYGSGTLSLTGSSAGAINVREGYLSLDNNTSTTTGMVTVYNGGYVLGSGKTAAVTVNQGGILGAGKQSALATSTLTLTGNLTVKSGGILKFRGRSTTSVDKFMVGGNVTLTSPVFDMTRLSGEWTADTDYKVLDCSGKITLSGTPTFLPEEPLPGYMWDYSQLASDGILRVVANPASGIEGVNADSEQEIIYDLNGRRIEQITSPGIYIINGKKKIIR